MTWLQSKPAITVYTDGACKKTGRGGWAAIILEDGFVIKLYGSAEATTNNRMELTAVIKALERLPKHSPLFLYSDSQYVVRNARHSLDVWRANGWKTQVGESVKNQDLWERLADLVSTLFISWVWVKGHDGDKWNNECDLLAVMASEVWSDEIKWETME